MASVTFGDADGGLLIVYEHLRMVDGRPHRFKYSYHANIGNDFVFRYDRDPVVHPEMPDHKHLPGGEDRRFDSGRVTLHEVAVELWDEISERDTLDGDA